MTGAARDAVSGLPMLPVLAPLEWSTVSRLRHAVADKLTDELSRLTGTGRAPLAAADVRMLGCSLIASELADHVAGQVHAGRSAPTVADEDALAAAVFAAIFGLGRLQALVDDPAGRKY